MAGNIPMGSMSTEIKLNGSQSVKTLRELKQAVTQATSAWKAQRAELSTIGKSTEAAEAKYKGLAETIKKQKDYISGLQEAQKHLTEAQKSVDRSTKEGRQEYGKYNEALQKNETRIHSAEQKLASLTNQQTKAKSSLNYYKSGLAEAQKQLQLNESVTKSYVARLSSEGKSYEAAKAQLNGYKDSIENLTKQQKIQEQELSKIASESGKSSEAYKRQQVRVNETATSLAKAKTQMTELDDSMRKANPSFLDRIRSKLTGVNKEADKTHHTFREVFMGSALGTALTNSLSNIGGQLKSIYKDGMEANSIAGKIDARFKNMGQSASGIKRLDAQIKELKYNTGMSADQIADLQTKMLNWSAIGQRGALQMTKAIAGIGDSSKMPADQIARMGASLMRVGSTGKVTYSALNRITKSAPTFYSQLAKGAGMSESKLKSLLQSGNVTQKQFQEWLAASSKYSDEAFKGYNATQAGAINRMQKAWADLKKTMTAPLFKAKSTGLQALSQLLTSKELMSGAKAIGQGISQAIGVIYKHRKDITDVAKDFIQLGVSVGKAVWKDFSAIFVDIAKSFHLISGNSKSAGGPMHQLRLAMDKLAKNKTAIQIIAKAIELIAVAKLANAADGLFHISKIVKGSAGALIGLTKGFKGVDDASKLEGTQKLFYKLAGSLKNSKLADLATKVGNGIANGFHKGLKGISKATSWLGKALLSAGKSLVSKAATLGKNIGNAITKAVKASTKFSMGKRVATGALAGAAVATPEVINAIKDRHSANKRSQDIGGAVGAVAGGTLTSMIPVVGPLLAPVGAIIGKYAGQWGGQAVNKFTKGWQRNKPPKKFWSLENLGYSAHNMWKGFKKSVTNVAKWFKKNWKEVGLYFVNPIAGAINSLYKHNKKFHKWVDGLVKSFKNAWKGMTHWFSNLGKSMAKGLKSAWKGMAKWFSNIGKGVRNAWHSMTNWFTRLGSAMSRGLKATWHTVARWFGGIARGVQRAWLGMSHFFGRVGSASVRLFKSAWHGITSWFGGIINGIKKAWDNLFDGISSTAKVIGKLLGGKVKVGNVHLANGTDWKHKYGYPAILNDGSDSPATGNREGILNPDGTVEIQQGTNVPRWIFPWQDVINAHDMARIFGRSVRLANGTVNLRSLETNDPAKLLSTLTKLTKKKYDEDRQHHEKQRQRHDRNDNDRAIERERLIKQEHDAKSERAKIAKEIREALSKGRNTKGLTAQFNALTKHISNIKHSIAKTNPHHGQVYVDEGLLIGAKSRIGKSKWISDALFKKLTTKPKATHKRASTRKHRTTRRRSYSSRSYSSVPVPKVRASNVSVGVSSKSVIVSAKVVGTKNVKALEKAMKRIKGGTRKITVKAKGSKSLKSLAKTVKKIKGKTSYIKVKTSGAHSLKSLSSHIASVHERVNSLNKSVKKAKFGTDIAKQAEKATKALKGEGNFAKVVNTMSKKSTKDFKDMAKSINKDTNKIRKSTESDFSNMYRKSYSSMNRLHSGVIRLAKSTASGFGNAMKKMVSYASDSMRGTIRQINRGIRGIDRVLKQFGGNSSVINPVHFAGGTDANGRLTHDTLAVVNDATTGPRQEAIVTDQNDVIIPHGDNRPMMLHKGWGVLNGTQTQSLGLPHFAKGTGVKKDTLRKLAENSLKHFADSFKSMFTKNIPSSGSDLTQGATDLGKNSGTHYGNPWSNAMWTVINNAMGTGGGTRAAFLRYAKETFDGVKYLMGAASKTLSDCSGMVMQALRHFGIDIGRTTVDMANSSGTKYLGKSLSKTEPGDLVIFGHGTGAAGHVGIINNPAKGTMFNETPPYARISKISDAMSMGYGYYRVKGLHDASKNHHKADPRLMALAKRELGHKALSWISDTLSENEGSMAGKPTGDHLHWMKQAHIPEKDWSSINWIVSSESGWNPHIVNPSSGTYGLGQMQSYNLHYYTRHGSKSNPIAQLMGIMDYIHDRYGSVANAVRFRKAHNWYANGGIANTPSIFGEAGPEMAIPLIPSKSTRAWELIGKAVGILSANSNFNNQQQVNSKEQKEEHDFRQAVLLLLTEIAGKSDVAKITLTTPAGRALWSIIQPFQKQDMKSEITRLRRGLSGGR